MPLTYGFRSASPRAQTFLHPFTGAVIATPVLDLSSNLGPQGYADRSGTGANGVPVGAPSNARGVFEDAIKFGGVRDYLNCGSNAPLNVTGSATLMAWLGPKDVTADSFVITHYGAAGGYALRVINGRVYAYDFGGATWPFSTAALMVNRQQHIAATLVNGGAYRLFIDGLQDTRGAFTGLGTSAGIVLYTGCFGGASNFFPGLIELPQIWNGALSPEQVYRNYLAAKDVPIYYDTFESYAVTPVAKAVGSMCGPFMVTVQSMLIVADAAGKKWLSGGAAAFCYGTGDWTEDCAYGTWEFDFIKGADAQDTPYFGTTCNNRVGYTTVGLNGYMFGNSVDERLRLYRITNGAAAVAFINSVAGTVAVGTTYSCRIVRRVDGQFTMYLKGGAYPNWTLVNCEGTGSTNPATDNTYTSGRFFNTVVRDVDRLSNLRFSRVCERPEVFPWEFSTGTYAGLFVGAGVIPFLRCLTAGVTYVPRDFNWTQLEAGIYKGADANVTDWLLVATEIGGATTAAQNGYGVRLSADERVQLIRMDNGVVTVLAQTAAAYIAVAEYYTLRILYNPTTAAWRVLIWGGAFADWTEAIPSTVDNTYTLGNYMCWDLDAQDRVTAPAKAY